LTPDEVAELDLREEESTVGREGLEFETLPIPDYGVPASRVALAQLVGRLKGELDAGKRVAVHCRQGIGRSSLLVASLLVAAGTEPDEAFRYIEKARGRPVPDTQEQREWVRENAMAPLAAGARQN
jgi:protein-tyrosine phosphatase